MDNVQLRLRALGPLAESAVDRSNTHSNNHN